MVLDADVEGSEALVVRSRFLEAESPAGEWMADLPSFHFKAFLALCDGCRSDCHTEEKTVTKQSAGA